MGLKQNLHTLKMKYKGTKMAPAFNAIHTFLYLPNETTHNGTHIKAADDLKRTMNMVIMSLVPCLLFAAAALNGALESTEQLSRLLKKTLNTALTLSPSCVEFACTALHSPCFSTTLFSSL